LRIIYYKGNAEDWEKIGIANDYWVDEDDALKTATRYYYSESEPALNEGETAYNGNYWRYVGGVATPWVYVKEE
jgi:hypothetical protein